VEQLFIYLDHNILDWLIKGVIKSLPLNLRNCEVCWVYSSETLKEIHRSKDSQFELVECLRKLEAWHLQPDYLNSRPLNTGQFARVDPAGRYRAFSEDLLDVGEPEQVLARIIPPLMGFKHAISIDNAMSRGVEYVRSLLERVAAELPAAVEELPEKERQEVLARWATLPPLNEVPLLIPRIP
jgi:hypothetical protein